MTTLKRPAPEVGEDNLASVEPTDAEASSASERRCPWCSSADWVIVHLSGGREFYCNGCGGDGAVASLEASASPLQQADPKPAEREQRWREAFVDADNARGRDLPLVLMAVADAEQSELRSEVDGYRLRATRYQRLFSDAFDLNVERTDERDRARSVAANLEAELAREQPYIDGYDEVHRLWMAGMNDRDADRARLAAIQALCDDEDEGQIQLRYSILAVLKGNSDA